MLARLRGTAIEEERLERTRRRLSLARRGAVGVVVVACLVILVAALVPEGFVLDPERRPARAVVPDLPVAAD